MRFVKQLAAAAVLAILAWQPARADTVDVTSTTLLRVGQETRGGQAAQRPTLETVAPAFEILSISARDVRNPVLDDLALVVSTWGSYDFGEERRWDNGRGSNLVGDVMTGYLQGKLAGRRLTLRLGRQHLMTGAARMIHLDGGEAIVMLPFGLRLSGYAGVPVSQRFRSRQSTCTRSSAGEICGISHSWNPAGGDLAYGGRVAFAYGYPGFPGRGVDAGVSVNYVLDHKDPVRQEAVLDLRLQPVEKVILTGIGAYSLYDERFSEGGLRAAYLASRALRVEADARYVAPDLLLARNSILSVFSAETRRSLGAGAYYRLAKSVEVGGAYHLELAPGREIGSSSNLGHEVEARVGWERGPTHLGAELTFLDALDNGYFSARVYGRRDLGRFFATADVLGHVFREEVNGEKTALTGALSAGADLARGFSAVVSGSAGVTPFLEQTYAVMAKLVYNSTYRIREVR